MGDLEVYDVKTEENEENKKEFKIKLNALELKLKKIKDILLNKSKQIMGKIEEDGKIIFNEKKFNEIYENMMKSDFDKDLIPFEKENNLLKVKDDAIVEINDKLINKAGSLIEFKDLDLALGKDLDLALEPDLDLDLKPDLKPDLDLDLKPDLEPDLDLDLDKPKEMLTGETSEVSLKREIATKTKLEEDDIMSIIVVENKEDASYFFKKGLNIHGEVKIVRDIHNNCIIIDEDNELIMGLEASKPAMELIDKLNLYRNGTSRLTDYNMERGRTEGQDYDDIIMLRNENYPNIQWLLDNSVYSKRKAELFEIKDDEEIRQIEVESIFDAGKNIKLNDKKIDIKEKKGKEITEVEKIEKTGDTYGDLLKKELEETQERINKLKKQYDGKEVDVDTAAEVASEMKMLTDKMKFLQQEFRKTESTRLNLKDSGDLKMEIKDEEKDKDDEEHIKVPWPTY